MRRSAELSLLVLAVGLIAFSTAFPIEVQEPIWQPATFGALDFAANLILYAPLGVALRKHRLLIVFLAAAALSAVMEILQLWSFVRYTSVYDVIANAFGAWLGAWAARTVQSGKLRLPESVPLTPPAGLAAAMAALALLGIRALPAVSSDLHGWDPGFGLVLGNEATGNRPWRGTLESLAIVPGPLEDSLEPGQFDLGAPDVRANLRERGAYLLPQAVRLSGGPPIPIDDGAVDAVVERIVERGAFAIIANLTSGDSGQEGPARIVSLSYNTLNRNFDLGQESRDLVFRVRTPSAGDNGNDPRTEAPNVVEAGRAIQVVAAYDGAIARIYVDGRLAGRTNLAAAGCRFPSLCDANAPLAQAALGASFAVVALMVMNPRKRTRILLAAVAAGAAAAIIVRNSFPHDPMLMFWPWIDAAAILGGLWIGMAARPREAGFTERRPSHMAR